MIKFDINLLFGIIDVIIFYLLMKKFLFGRIKKVMEKRQALIAEELEAAENKNRAADEKLAECENRIKDCEAEGQQLLHDARERADAEYARTLAAAEADAAALKEAAQQEIAAQRDKSRREAKEEIAALAMEAAEKVLGSAVGEEENDKLMDAFLNDEGKHE